MRIYLFYTKPNLRIAALLVRFTAQRAREIHADLADDHGEVDRQEVIELSELGEYAIWLKTLLALSETQTDYCMQFFVISAWRRAQCKQALTLVGALRLMQGEAKVLWRLWMLEQPQVLEQMLEKLKEALSNAK